MSHSVFHRVVLIALAIVTAAALAAPAAAADSPWTLHLRGAWVDGDLSYAETVGFGDRITATDESKLGLGLDVEYRLNDRFGVAGGVLWSKPEVKLRATQPGTEPISTSTDFRFMPVTAGLAIHLTPDGPVDVIFTPGIAWISYGDLEFDDPAFDTVDLADDFTWTASLGIDWAAGDSILLSAAVSYFDTDIEPDHDGPDSLSYDPFVYSIGVGFRF